MFNPNRHFRRDYNRIFKKSPETANLFLLLCELADDQGQIRLGLNPEVELQELLSVRFNDPTAYQLPGGPTR